MTDDPTTLVDEDQPAILGAAFFAAGFLGAAFFAAGFFFAAAFAAGFAFAAAAFFFGSAFFAAGFFAAAFFFAADLAFGTATIAGLGAAATGAGGSPGSSICGCGTAAEAPLVPMIAGWSSSTRVVGSSVMVDSFQGAQGV